MQISERGTAQCIHSEGCVLEAYPEPDGTYSIGYGHNGAKPTDRITEARARELLVEDLERVGRAVESQAAMPLTQGQFDALCCLGYNIGIAALKHSTLMRKFNTGDTEGASWEFLKWDKVGGHSHPGLAARRREERELFLS